MKPIQGKAQKELDLNPKSQTALGFVNQRGGSHRQQELVARKENQSEEATTPEVVERTSLILYT